MCHGAEAPVESVFVVTLAAGHPDREHSREHECASVQPRPLTQCGAASPHYFRAARTRTQQQPPLRSLVGLRHGRRPPSRLPRRAVPSRSGPRSPAASRSAPCSSTRESAHVRHRGDLEYAPSREIPVSEWECPARRGCPRRRTTHQDSVLELARER